MLLGLKIKDLSSVDAAVKSAELVSMIPHTVPSRPRNGLIEVTIARKVR